MQEAKPVSHPAFQYVRSQTISSLNLVVEEYEHLATGAKHYHLSADNPENVFLVALRTVPQDSTGVAHILEHTALCGSERYPVRDPFFMMTRRSLNTFMNAFTSSDWTAYPFASVNRKDFGNLLEVYLDAVFFSRLDPLDFAQEGHRLEFAQPDNPESELVFKGVVYNEMKGAMSSVTSMLWHTLNKYLHPATTYHFNSGGEPDCIPNLTYEQLVHFYKTHYHPSNAIFMTYGDIPAVEHQTKFEELALNRFQRLDKVVSVPDEQRYYSPVRIEEKYPLAEDENSEKKTHVVMAWLLGHSADLTESLTANLLSSVLLDNSSCPLLHALETTELGNAPSPLCGLDDSQKELAFVCGLEGCSADDVDAVENLILDTLSRIAIEGIPLEDVEAALHQLELHQREIGGDSYPYGLQLIMNALTAATHRGDPVAMLDVDSALSTLRSAIQRPEFIKEQVRKLLIDNPHRVRLSLVPDSSIPARKEQAEKDRLAKIKNTLSEEQKQEIVRQAALLVERQSRQDDESILPKVTLADVPATEPHLEADLHELPVSKRPLATYSVGSNGLVYQQVVIETPPLTERQLAILPYYTSCVTELGIGDKTYMEAQRWQARVSGSMNAFSSIRSQVDDIHRTQQFLTFSSKALVRNHEAVCELMTAILEEARFDEHSRVRDLVAQMRASREQAVTGSGHALAMGAATSGMCAASKLSFQQGGLEGIRRIKALHEELKNDKKLAAFCDELAQIHQLIRQAPRRFLLIGENDQQPKLQQTFARWFDSDAVSVAASWELPPMQEQIRQGWLTNSQVNFCAKAYATVPMTHPDAAPLVVLGNVLRNGFLHRAIREQGGAYGGGAGQDSNSAAFRFYSYRDPRLEETLADFDRSIDWLMSTNLPWQAVEEAILGVISGIDKPDSPAGRAKRMYHNDLHGRTLALRQQFRERVLATRQEDLRRVVETYLAPEKANIAVITDHSKQEQIGKLGLETLKL
ncbi:peptidase M16 [Saccharophagus sp. K07]|uniref:insulinase family protein n=1 Tax=Saccharophagus sp. K07 TaxID=2283636 RepID=UPI0016525D7C|nr:insulinase family protein [Saccharophagus sp. K07]MBC6906958.1 peptidase M16 [Saccharophagus sp. K07]